MQSMVQPCPRALPRFLPGLLRRLAVGAAVAVAGAAAPQAASAQWVTTFEQFYYPAEHNWVYREKYPFADRLFNAFDYGHSILYEELYTRPNAPASRLEERQYNFLTRKVLPNPPRVPLEETAIEIQYSRLAPEAKLMFEWAHVLHRQSYDVLADESLSQAAKDEEMAKLLAYYKSRPDVKFSSRPKSMKLMQEQPYSLAFRKNYPKFNGLIWGYHWLQVGLYEPLMVGRTFDERQALSTAAVARFRQMLQDPPRAMPYQMPMTAAVSPTFAARYPEYAIIFDNLHSMHDVVSDILANDSVPRDRKRPEIVRAGRLFRDDTSYVMGSTAAWLTMSRQMGQENMGGPAVGFTPALPTPTVTYGAVMSHDDTTGKMVAMKYGQMTGNHGGMNMSGGTMQGMDHSGMSMPGMPGGARADSGAMGGMNHAGMAMPADTAGGAMGRAGEMNHGAMQGMPGMQHGAGAGGAMGAATDSGAMPGMMDMHMRMMADPVIRRRMMADPEMRRMMTQMMDSMPADHRAMMEGMIRDSAPAARPRSGAARRPARTAPAPRRPARPAADPHAGHEGMAMPGANAAPAKPAAPAARRPAARPAPKPPATPPARDSMPGMDHSKMPGMGKP